MTDKQEIRAKSAELAIRLIAVAAGTQPERANSLMPKALMAEAAQGYFDTVTNLAKQFEAFITDFPGST
jgi:hypothetical protein